MAYIAVNESDKKFSENKEYDTNSRADVILYIDSFLKIDEAYRMMEYVIDRKEKYKKIAVKYPEEEDMCEVLLMECEKDMEYYWNLIKYFADSLKSYGFDVDCLEDRRIETRTRRVIKPHPDCEISDILKDALKEYLSQE